MINSTTSEDEVNYEKIFKRIDKVEQVKAPDGVWVLGEPATEVEQETYTGCCGECC